MIGHILDRRKQKEKARGAFSGLHPIKVGSWMPRGRSPELQSPREGINVSIAALSFFHLRRWPQASRQSKDLTIRHLRPKKREGAPLGSALLPLSRNGLYPGFCPPLAEMEDHFSMRRPGGRPGLRPARASSALRPTALLPTGFGYARNLAVPAVGSYPTFSPLPSRAVIFCATFRRRGIWPSPPRISTGVTLYGVRKFLPPLRASDPPAVPEID